MEDIEEVKKRGKRKESRYGNRYGFEVRLRCVKWRLEEGFPASLLSKELGVSKDVVYRWVKAYQERGEAGLRNRVTFSGGRRKLLLPIREKIVLGAAENSEASLALPLPGHIRQNLPRGCDRSGNSRIDVVLHLSLAKRAQEWETASFLYCRASARPPVFARR